MIGIIANVIATPEVLLQGITLKLQMENRSLLQIFVATEYFKGGKCSSVHSGFNT